MAVKWTEEQRRVIDTRGRNILVSAAAGSGKTAVLVARILALVTGEGPELPERPDADACIREKAGGTQPVDGPDADARVREKAGGTELADGPDSDARAGEKTEKNGKAREAAADGSPEEKKTDGKENTNCRKPVDIDRLLVVTFTNAAAAEMRERIRDALEQRAAEEPENDHLQRQLVLVHNAKITTIHSFCLHVLRNHFQTAGIDPAFRVADEGEVLLLEQDTARETVDDAYEHADEEYLRFLEVFTTGKGDQAIEDTVLQLYHFALGQPWPEDWLRECREQYEKDFLHPGYVEDVPGKAERAEDVPGNTERAENLPENAGRTDDLLQDDAPGAEKGRERKSERKAPRPAWMIYIEEDTARLLDDLRRRTEEALQIAQEPDGPYPYIKALESDLDLVETLAGGLERGGYEGCARAFSCMGPFARLGTKRDESISQQKKQLVQDLRAGVRDALADLRKHYYFADTETLVREFRESGLVVRVLTKLAEDFMERLAQKKAEQNIVDFGDLEHLALRVLVERSDGRAVPTAAAQEYAENFEEIMIDEYQDSNLVQDILLSSISGRGRGEKNLFMVGDVKQSIYRFRLARPELFMEKYRTYQSGEEQACRIDLHRNFRSRAQVLDGVNYIFRQIMTEYPGGIVYDRDAALYPGAQFPEGADESFPGTEFLLLEAAGQERQREEAALVGRRIREIVGNAAVWDREEGCYRPARCGDIVILLRTVSGWADVFGEVLGDMGIPCVTGSQKGYFSAVEIRTVLAYLQILDNPVQDIPLAAVMRSAIGKFSDEELSQIRIFSDRKYFYDCCQEYRAAGPQEMLRGKLEQFFTVYEQLRGKCDHTPVHLLLWEILDVTGYGAYAEALPAGRQRRANLDMLVEKAIAYESASYRGLYHFVRYIENLKKYEVDYGEANIDSEAGDTVRIMSIHKSKGLEFPIVFVCGLGKQFNETDIRSRVVMHPDFGAACDFVDDKLRTRRASLLKRAIQQKTAAENLGEELRVLYVAMTRAKEKLILTGSAADVQTKFARWQTAVPSEDMDGGSGTDGEPAPLSPAWIAGASTCLDWIVPALLRHPAAREFAAACQEEPEEGSCGTGGPHALRPGGRPAAESPQREQEMSGLPRTESAAEADSAQPFTLRLVRAGDEREEQFREDSRETLQLRGLEELEERICSGLRDQEAAAQDWKAGVQNREAAAQAAPCFDAQARAYLEHVFASVYPYAANAGIPGKLSVSELKKLSHLPEEQDARELYREETVIPLLPEFRTGKKAIAGAARGTVYHAFMENLDFSGEEELEIQLEEMISCGKMSREEGGALDLEDIRTFLRSSCGQRMRRAFLAGQLFRERPFVLGVPASGIRKGFDPQETVLVQGIIDAYFIEEGQITVLDYKTDRVDRIEELAEKYHAQLDYYALALERLTGLEVRERIIYSFCLGEEIIL